MTKNEDENTLNGLQKSWEKFFILFDGNIGTMHKIADLYSNIVCDEGGQYV